MRLTTRFALAALFAFSMINIVGCGDDEPTGPDNSSDPIVAPKQGSTFNYSTYQTDATGQKVAGTDSTYVVTVASTGMTFQGKSNVNMFVQTQAAGSGVRSDTSYVAYEANGDVSVYLGKEIESLDMEGVEVGQNLWFTIPYASKSTKSATIVDAVDPMSGGTIKITVSGTGTGNEEVTVGSQKFNARKGDMKIDAQLPLLGFPVTVAATYTQSFVPKLGVPAKTVTKTVTSLGGISSETEGSVETMTSYTLK